MFKFEMGLSKLAYKSAGKKFTLLKDKGEKSIKIHKWIYEWEVDSFKSQPVFLYITMTISIITVILNYLSMFSEKNDFIGMIEWLASVLLIILFVTIFMYLILNIKRSWDAEKAYYILKFIEEYEKED